MTKFTKRKKGGALGETLRFKYTKNPLRVGWTEAIYPLAPLFLQIPEAIPWDTYSFTGTSTVELEDTNNNSYVNTAVLSSLNNNTLQKKYEAMFNYKDVNIKAKTNLVPYVIFGGSACELYNSLVYKKTSFNLDLHKTTDPTGDMDVECVPLNVVLEATDNQNEMTVVMYNDLTNKYSALYDDYTRWIISKLKPLLEPIAEQMKSKQFFAKEQAGNAELVDADIIIPIGNLLLTRSITKRMIKIQCGVGVQTPDGPVQDHIFEFIIPINNTHKVAEQNDILNVYKVPVQIGSKSFSLIVQDPVTLLNGQSKAFLDRIKLSGYEEKSHKIFNHYGRMIFCLELLIWAYTKNIPPRHYNKIFFPYINEILESGILDLEPSPCFPKCDKDYIKNVYEMVLSL